MSEQRKRPQYGEYASAEEQRASIRDPEVRRRIAEAAADGAQEPVSHPASTQPAPPSEGSAVGGPSSQGITASGGIAAPRSRWDVALTFVLLAAGLIDVVTSLPGYLHMSQTMVALYSQIGIHGSPDGTRVAVAGLVLALVRVAVWLVAASLAAWRMRVHRRAFWIPLAGAAVSYLTVVIIMVAVVATDPAFQTFLGSR
jgi:hypothetical protein